MNMKKAILTIPLSAVLLFPATHIASAHEGHMHGDAKKTSSSQEVSNKATDLRAALDQLFSEHAYLAVITMQKGIDGSKDFDQAAAALNENTNDLSDAIASVYGKKAGKQFKDIWSSHIGYFVDYVQATAKRDEAGKKKAVKQLDQYRMKQADMLDKATGGRLKASELEEGLKMHVNELLKAFNSYTEKDFDTTYDTVRKSIHHMFEVGKGVSWAMTDQFPGKFDQKSVDTPAADLREDLNYLFSEHLALAVVAMQKGNDGSKDFDQAAAALNENTNDLSDAIASVYGKDAGKQFKTIWSSHIGYLVDYVKADASGDEKAKEKAVKDLDAYRMKQATFLDQATDGRLKAADLEAGLKTHIDELIKTYTSYHQGEYDQLYPTVREAYGHMFMVGQDVATAIVDQHPELFKSKMPNEMPKTGMGGTAGPLGMSYEAFAGMIASLILAGGAAGAFFLIRRKTSNSKS